jgi:dienelactone hydrolase
LLNSKVVTCRLFSLAMAIVIAGSAFCAGQNAGELDPSRIRGTVVPSVSCVHDPSQSYALYLPSNYSPDRRWPIIYAFDPFARGKVPVELYKQAAEKYGYIVAGSNNAKNGPGALEMAAAQAVWEDTHRRFAIDKDRVYTTGLSGGARFATSFALYCYTCSVAGVIAHGATYPVKEAGAANDHFLYYVAIGDQDFNLPEVAELRAKKEAQGAAFKVKVYPGPHQWAPADVVENAVAWLELKAMQAGKEKPNPAFIQEQFQKTQAEATQAEQAGDTLTEFYALRSLAFDFKGLVDVSRFESQFQTLKKSKELQHAEKQEKHEIDRQRSLTETAGSDIAGLAQVGPEQVPVLQQRIMSVFDDLRRHLKSTAKDRLIYVRAFNQLWIQGIEDGEEQYRNREYVRAANYFQVMADVAPDQSWPLLLLAETKVREGDKKAALKALDAAVKRGVKSPLSLTGDPELAPLQADPEFQRIVGKIGKVKSAS